MHALAYRLVGRCWACHRLVVLHTPRQLRHCEGTPLAIVLTDPDAAPVSRADQGAMGMVQ
jgi:hypothetical protein